MTSTPVLADATVAWLYLTVLFLMAMEAARMWLYVLGIVVRLFVRIERKP